jgi:DNA-binding transcriptional LysR family regulator
LTLLIVRMGEPQRPEDLARGEAVLTILPGFANSWTFRRGSEEITVALKGRLGISAGEGVRAAVLAGAGFTIGSEWLFAPELRDGRVRPALTGWSLPPLDLWALFPSGRLASGRARAFTAFMEERLAGILAGPAPGDGGDERGQAPRLAAEPPRALPG